MPTYKLTYFDFRGLAEPIRLLLSYGGQEFKDVRLEYGGEEWQKLKPTTPFGVMPILEIDGKKPTFQHIAIARYLAKQYKLIGDNDWEALQADIVVDTISDLKTKLYPALWGPDPEVVKKNLEEVQKTTLPFYLERLNALAGNSGHLANGKLTWADLYFFAFIELIEKALGNSIAVNYPNLKKVHDNVLSIPKVKSWVDKRPKTDF